MYRKLNKLIDFAIDRFKDFELKSSTRFRVYVENGTKVKIYKKIQNLN